MFVEDTTTGLIVAAVLAGIGLFAVGALKTVQTKRNPWLSGVENLGLGLFGGVLAYLVGRTFDVVIAGN